MSATPFDCFCASRHVLSLPMSTWLTAMRLGSFPRPLCHARAQVEMLFRCVCRSPQASPGTRFEQETQALARFLIQHLAAELEFAVTCMAALGILLRTSKVSKAGTLIVHDGIAWPRA